MAVAKHLMAPHLMVIDTRSRQLSYSSIGTSQTIESTNLANVQDKEWRFGGYISIGSTAFEVHTSQGSSKSISGSEMQLEEMIYSI